MKFVMSICALLLIAIAADAAPRFPQPRRFAPPPRSLAVGPGASVVQQNFGPLGRLRSQTIVNGGSFGNAAIVSQQRAVIGHQRAVVQNQVFVQRQASFSYSAAVVASPVVVQSAPVVVASPVYFQAAPVVVLQAAPVLIQTAPVIATSTCSPGAALIIR